MKALALLIALVSITQTSIAGILQVNGGPGSYPDLASAVSAAAPHDTIFMSASVIGHTLPAGYWYIDRPIHIVGAGWPTAANVGTVLNLAGSHIVFMGTATGSSMEGMSIAGTPSITSGPDSAQVAIRVLDGCTELTFRRIVINNNAIYACGYATYYATCISIWSPNLNLVLDQCGFYRGIVGCYLDSYYGKAIVLNAPETQLIMSNCVFSYLQQVVTNNESCEINANGCIFWYTPISAQALWTGGVANSLFWGNNVSPGALQFSYNGGNITPVGTNWTAVSSNPFVNLPVQSLWSFPTHDLHLVPGSPAIDAGVPADTDRDGSPRDLGVHGGQAPFVGDGFPGFPVVTGFAVPATVPQNGVLPVTSTGRIGPGQ